MPAETTAAEPADQPFIETLKIAAYGPFGSQKTRQIGYLIEQYGPKNVGIVSAERGLNTIRSLVYPDCVFTVNSFDDTRRAWAWANEHFNAPDKWVCIDGGSRVMQFIANERFMGAEKAYDHAVRGLPLPKDLMEYGRYLREGGAIDAQALYGRIGRDSENLLNSWIRLNSNLYVNYLEDMTESDGRKKLPPYGPDVPGKVGLRAVMSSFDYVLRLGYDAGGRLVGLTGRTPLYLARTREDREAGILIPAEMPGFRMDEFVRLISHKTILADA